MTVRRWITVLGAALVVSLALNLFFFGVIAGHRLGPRGQADQFTPARLERSIERVARVLPDADAALLRSRFEAGRADLGQRFLALQEARRGVGQALRAEPFDAAALAAAYEAMQARSQEWQAGIHGVIKTVLPQLSPAGRTAVAERRWLK
jgi:uncharacterized membrane protein